MAPDREEDHQGDSNDTEDWCSCTMWSCPIHWRFFCTKDQFVVENSMTYFECMSVSETVGLKKKAKFFKEKIWCHGIYCARYLLIGHIWTKFAYIDVFIHNIQCQRQRSSIHSCIYIRALWRSVWAPECPNVKKFKRVG